MKKRGVILSTIVQKYGGTSMGSIEKIKSVAKKVILEKEKGNNKIEKKGKNILLVSGNI